MNTLENTDQPKPKPVKIEWGTNIHPAIQILEYHLSQKKKHG